MMKKKIFILLKGCVTLGLLYYIFKDIQFAVLFKGMKQVNIILLIFAFSLFYISVFLMGVRLSYILGDTSYNIYITKINFIAIFLNNFIPGSITTDLYKGYKLKDFFSKGKIIFGILLDRGSGMMIGLLFFAISGLFFISFLRNNFDFKQEYFYLAFIVLCLGIIGVYLFRKKIVQNKTIQEIFHGFRHLSLKKIYTIILISIAIKILTPCMFWTELLAIDMNLSAIPFYYIIFITTTIELVSLFPLTIKGYGVREFIRLTLLSPFGVTVETIAIVSIFIIINDLLASSIGAYLFHKDKLIPIQTK